ncbi:dienelactone hydrolase [Saitoella complicata NRRL Y-17804]|nr:dienelactone hydrolase [Saitoella complicata NRRL Y-17804]ODQ54562.1 dienelactone hydrolase [Saitoella complicata NRRL Y-17804]
MTEIHNTNEACCSIPPVQSNYQPKGITTTINGLETYVTSNSSKKILICIYDIFGFHPQTKQGADILATAGFKVYMPDFFRGSPFPASYYPPDTKEKKDALQKFFGAEASVKRNLEVLKGVVGEVVKGREGESVCLGVYGFCWGGKLSVLASGSSTPFKAAAMIHPAMVDPADARALTIPICALPSKDEDKNTMQEFENVVKEKKFGGDCVFKRYDTMHHGWMAARGDMAVKEQREMFDDGMKELVSFFKARL